MVIAKLWAKKLLSGEKLWIEVPDIRKGDVKSLLKEEVLNGKITEEKYMEITGLSYYEE